MVMETTDLGYGNHLPMGRRADWAWLRTIQRQGQVRPKTMIIVHVRLEQAPKMSLVKHDDMIEEIPTDAPDEPFDVRILPRRAGRNHDLFDPHVLDALPIGPAIDAVPIAEEMPGGLVSRKRLDHLLRGPHGRWVFSDVHVYDASALMCQDHEEKEDLERHCRHGEEIEGHHILYVVFQEGLPRGRG